MFSISCRELIAPNSPAQSQRFEPCRSKRGSERCPCHTFKQRNTIPLTATELALLRKLADNRGHIVTYDSLCSAVWGADYYGYENSLGVHIRHLRQKLEQDPNQPRCLLTVRGIGYKLVKEELP